MKSFIKKLFSPKKLSLKACPGCLDAALPLFPQGALAELASLPTPFALRGRFMDVTSFADPTDYPGHITQYAPDVFVWYDEAGMMSGVEYSLEAAQQAAKQYVARLAMPVVGLDVQIADLMDALHLETERADSAGRNASEFEDRMGQLQVENGKLYDQLNDAGEWDAAQIKVIQGLNDKVSALGGVNKRLRSKLRMARNARNRQRARAETLHDALAGMVEYFPVGHSDGECFSLDKATAALRYAK